MAAAQSIAGPYRHLEWSDLFKVTEGADPLSDADQQALNDYLWRFAEPPHDGEHALCIGCGATMRGGIEGVLLGGAPGSATWTWSLAHGECHCSACGYPARAYHYDIGGTGDAALIQRLTLTLQYHPDVVRKAEGS